jgi:hypothetical protein
MVLYMPFKQVVSLQAMAFARLLNTKGQFAIAQSLFECRIFKKLCLKWAELYSDCIQIPHKIVTTFDIDYDNCIYVFALRTSFHNYTASPNLLFVEGQGCAHKVYDNLKFVGIIRMEHVNKQNQYVVQKNWDVIYVQCFVLYLNTDFFNMLLECCKRFNKFNLNKLLYDFYNKTCET